jgi:hypothetical protein
MVGGRGRAQAKRLGKGEQQRAKVKTKNQHPQEVEWSKASTLLLLFSSCFARNSLLYMHFFSLFNL